MTQVQSGVLDQHPRRTILLDANLQLIKAIVTAQMHLILLLNGMVLQLMLRMD